MQYSQGRLLVMAKAPEAGLAKTRLIPVLGEEGAAQLQRYFIERQLDQTVKEALAPVELWCAGDCTHPWFLECSRRFGIERYPQQGKDLGERLQHALETALQDADFAIVIGCDIPQLDTVVLAEACQAMQQDVDAVLVPAEDGGYALLGLREASSLLFDDIEWGSGQVLAQTRERLRRLGWRWRELAPLWDVDRPADLPRLMRLRTLPEEIRRMLEKGIKESATEVTEHTV